MSATKLVSSNARAELIPVPPFDFARSLSFLGFFPPTQSEQHLGRRRLVKAITLGGQTVVFDLQAVGSLEAPELACQLTSDRLISDETKTAVLERISHFLSLGDDLRSVYRLASEDEPFRHVVKQLYGYHQVKFLTPFESACWAILSQRTPLALARRAKRALSESLGGSLVVDGLSYPAFPEAGEVLSAGAARLLPLVRHTLKVERLLDAARAFAEGDESFLKRAPYDEVKAWLLGIKGIGEWSADFILIRGLGRMERLPAEKRLSDAASAVYGRALSMAELQALAAPYGDHKGYWAHYLRVFRDERQTTRR